VLHEVLAMVSSEGGALTARREPCPVAPRLEEAAATQAPWRQPRVVVEPGLVALVQPGHLDQILANLLSNAEKYAGGATEIRGWSAPTGEVLVSVTDAGDGIAPAFRQSLFQRFSRDTLTAGSVTGTGLGLFISRELARANGGDLRHEDVSPRGSRFVLTLPAAEH
jgi:signal transduction histidine kinase